MISGSKGQNSVRTCTIRCLTLRLAKYEKVAIYIRACLKHALGYMSLPVMSLDYLLHTIFQIFVTINHIYFNNSAFLFPHKSLCFFYYIYHPFQKNIFCPSIKIKFIFTSINTQKEYQNFSILILFFYITYLFYSSIKSRNNLITGFVFLELITHTYESEYSDWNGIV